ncbi:hypothetical protein [Nonomuraea jiangxiensis]|uniref:Uncharacterized protein n=1 Tax=Nonomuraea jiangxiensis TaxID=633440 RepID=A0A1G9UMS5_9ACTN|nr:hypothetical protein [Nonomuraea jiangxiensis]SDM61144.1 hypothetical protein SAMN05421869_14922 [Nonomuraea jiangxiensis]
MSVVSFPGQPDPAPIGPTTAIAVDRFLDSITAATTRAGYAESLTRLLAVARPRALDQAADYRDPTPAEWAEFEQHFQLRRVALGDCFRPYGTPYVHEHANDLHFIPTR